MKIKQITLSIIWLITFAALNSCTTMSYAGKSYTSAGNKIDIYYAKEDIKNDFEVMGKAIATTPTSLLASFARNKLKLEAKLRGADAIFFFDLDNNHSDFYAADRDRGTRMAAEFIKYL